MQYDQFYKKNKQHTLTLKPIRRFLTCIDLRTMSARYLLRFSLIAPAIALLQTKPVLANDSPRVGDIPGHLTHLNYFSEQEKIEVTGIVNDDSGLPAPGVSVRVKGTSVATSTDSDGAFRIEMEAGQTLTFNSIGFDPYERVIAQAGHQDISLQKSSENISEVVVVGYGSQQRRDVTGSIAAVS